MPDTVAVYSASKRDCATAPWLASVASAAPMQSAAAKVAVAALQGSRCGSTNTGGFSSNAASWAETLSHEIRWGTAPASCKVCKVCKVWRETRCVVLSENASFLWFHAAALEDVQGGGAWTCA